MQEFLRGADLSGLPELIDKYDYFESEEQIISIYKANGLNAVRLRIWHTPSNEKYSGGYCDLERTLKMAAVIKKLKLNFMLDFHYSDYWADPGKQNKPLAWEKLHKEELEEAVYSYTKEVLTALNNINCLPDIIQIGNEIRSGLLFPDGQMPNVSQMTRLINAGIKAVRDFGDSSVIKVMIHLDQGGRFYYLRDWFRSTINAGLSDFDVIGLSYYPFWHGTFEDLDNSMRGLIKEFNKPIMVVETAHPWRMTANGFIDDSQLKISGFDASVEAQKNVIELVGSLVADLPDNMGQGYYYWEPVCIPDDNGGWSSNMGIVSPDGKIFDSIKAYNLDKTDLVNIKSHLLSLWQKPVDSVLTEFDGRNILLNSSFDDGQSEWIISCSENVIYNTWLDTINYIDIVGNSNFTFSILQNVCVDASSKYVFAADIQGSDTTGVEIYLKVKTSTHEESKIVHPSEHAFNTYLIENLSFEKEDKITVGIEIISSPMHLKIRGIKLIKLNNPQVI